MKFRLRELRGLGIVAAGGQIKRLRDKLFLVKSQSTSDHRKVEWHEEKWSCNCPDYAKRGKPCKHIYAVNFLLNLPQILITNIEALQRKCPYCGSSKTVRVGHRFNKTGAVQLRLCKSCDRTFKEALTPQSRGNNAAIALIALDLYYKKLSLREIKNHIWQAYGIEKPVSTLHSWIIRFAKAMSRAVRDTKLHVSDKWLGDEMVVKVNGRNMYLWNIMDYKTRQQIVSVLTEGRGENEAYTAIRQAIEKAGKKPKEFVTDGLSSYSKAMEGFPNHGIKHISNVRFVSQKNNNRIERLHGTIRDWTRTRRGMKSRCQELMHGYSAYYNHVRPHMSFGDKAPARPSTGNTWISLIGKSVDSSKLEA